MVTDSSRAATAPNSAAAATVDAVKVYGKWLDRGSCPWPATPTSPPAWVPSILS